jgi:hypothetical protein
MNPAPHTPQPVPTPNADTGRDANGRFARGNPGGPGNPYYRRQAQLERALLDGVTEDDVRSVMQVLLGLARGGDLAAIKLYLQYTVGQPKKDIDPDQADLHEWELHRRKPRLAEVGGLMAEGIETREANRVARDVVPIVGACHLQTLSQHLRSGTDLDGEQVAPPLEEGPPAVGPSGGKPSGMSARRMAPGVRVAEETGDNGGRNSLNELLAEFVRAVHSVENGPERTHEGTCNLGLNADQPAEPDSQ